MRPRTRASLAVAVLALGSCAVAGPGCNALSGVESFVVEPVASEASSGGKIAQDGAGGDGTPTQSPTDGSAEAMVPTGSDASPDAEVDANADARLSPDATNDAAQDAADGDGSCRVVHSNGIGQSFEDCVPLGTHNMTQATAACVAYTGDAAQCVNNPPGCTSASVCSSGAAMCACWRYVGPAGGHVSPPATTCSCASGSSPAWD